MGVRADVSMTNNFGTVTEQILQRLVAGENKAAERGVALAVDLSPMDQGNLRAAHHVEPATNPTEGAQVVVDAPQAARLHEHPEYDFSTDANPNAQGKWVETAMVENKSELGAIIAKEVRGG
ncbi:MULTISPECIES: hypothetical protein [unclassified Microbacterium]|uniref:hypothetical protein n=1 Tax=unclassified Microbacterium TaxID=2609290 RepID=UPI0016053276|nr:MULTISPECIES: hypothetical protein [unclassified Microbacterium]QNA93261.1 hypothetical protein G4G29_14750 [Microbacterium sp. Se63.02b]QYM63470.1 hypothetical protein K1X59_14800 [Microbacterium sp. Se5.02b]